MPVLARRSFSEFVEIVARQSEGDGGKGGISTKMALEYGLVTVACVLALYIIFRRVRGLKPPNQTYRQFFIEVRQRRSPHHIPRNPTFNRTPGATNADGLAPIPAAYQGYSTRRTQAQDVDASGRRIGGAEVDHDGALDDKDILPAYDMYGGPPRYFEPLPPSDTPSSVELRSREPVDEAPARDSDDYADRPPSPGAPVSASAMEETRTPSRSPSSPPTALPATTVSSTPTNTQTTGPS